VRINDIIRERLGTDISTFAGATTTGEVPLPDEFVNGLIAERLAGHAQIAALQVQAQEGDVVAVQFVPRARLLPPVRILARVERQPEFPENPRLILRWTMPAAGPLAMFAAPVLSYFKALPPGIRMNGDRLVVDVAESLRSRGFDEVLGFVRRLTVHTRPREFLVRFELGVERRRPDGPDEGGPEGPPLRDAGT
jgi:hypothetical protein